MELPMEPKLLANLPEWLGDAALVNGEEAAWEQKDCLAAIKWLSENNYALLGLELWLIRDDGMSTAISTKSSPAIYVTNCNPTKGETWKEYVQRSAREAADHIAGFRWPEDSLEPPRTAYFNLTWADREWFWTQEKNAKHTFDE
ncbi:MAG TPA: hypothetical protein VH114_14195 [Candidatus Acidoferrum sp.]|jgi:hypothetical protein|nr:hypothetical protein [Candidatus Acidoferrum sp.]